MGLFGSGRGQQPSPMEVQASVLRSLMQWLGSQPSDAEWLQRTLTILPTAQAVQFTIAESSDVGVREARGVLPAEQAEEARTLQRVGFNPQGGTWLSAQLVVTSSGSGDASFNFDRRPGPVGEVEGLSDEDLRAFFDAFPRSSEAVADWMRPFVS